MEKKELLRTLEVLHEELHGIGSVDEKTQSMLAALTEDIRRLSEPNNGNSAEATGKLTAQIQDLMLKFESDHPQLTGALNQVSTALANLGI